MELKKTRPQIMTDYRELIKKVDHCRKTIAWNLRINNICTRKLPIESLQVLTTLAIDEKEELSVLEIASKIGVTHPSVSISLKKLSANGYVECQGHKQDGRKTVVIITEEGKKIFKRIHNALKNPLKIGEII
jgi:DNA-binding MarR family transcriptional regulator